MLSRLFFRLRIICFGGAGDFQLKPSPSMQAWTKATFPVLLLAGACCLLSCAKEGMPPGGPEDTTAPEVLVVSPAAGATEVPQDSKVEIVFSERMTPEITEQSIFISPLPREPFQFRWKGRKLTLSPQEPLDADRTYVISIGADAQDLRRNRLGQTFTLAFSTGSRLDFGTISGRVWATQEVGLARQTGAGVWAYLLSQDHSKLDPAVDKPDYVTQTDDQGAFVLKNLSVGTYRLFAVQDLNRDLLWNPENEPIGVTTRDVELADRQISAGGIDFVVGLRDKRNPVLSSCSSPNRAMVRLDFDEELERRSAWDIGNYRLTSAADRQPVNAQSAFFPDADAKRVILLVDEMIPQQEYDLSVAKVTDKAGNVVDTSANGCRFVASGLPDTVGLEITVVEPADGGINVPPEAGITLTFSRPPDRQMIEASFHLLDPSNAKVSGSGEWLGPNLYCFRPDSLLAGGTEFRASLPGADIRGPAGNVSPLDSVFSSAFITVKPETSGSVSGVVETGDDTVSSPTSLILWQQESNGVLYRLSLTKPGPFKFDWVLPGKYLLAAYLDLNQDGLLSLGEPEPFSAMEPFEVHPDTIQVRSRWETEIANLLIGPR